MHDQLINEQVARLHREETLRKASRRQAPDLEPRVRIAVGRHFATAVRSVTRRAAWQAPQPRTTDC
jgi:hypothetical protein